MKNLKYVFYFESLLMTSTFVMATTIPETFITQVAPGIEPSALAINLARWYGVPFLPLTLIQLHTLWSGNRYGLRLVMLTYLLTDLTQLGMTFVFAGSLGWALAHYVSAITAVIFVASRATCYFDLERVGVRLQG